jgi:CRP/FNR family cyclic AMP-dependent transcriptional regulator
LSRMKKDSNARMGRGEVLSGESLEAALKALAELPIIAGLEAAALSILRGRLSIREYRPGAVVVKYGEPGDSCSIIIRGSVSVVRIESNRGRELTYRSLGAGAIFGELALLTETPRTTDIIADDKVWVAEIPGETFLQLLAASPSFSLYLLRSLAGRLRTSSERLSDLSFLDLNQRLLVTLSRLSTVVEIAGEKRKLVRELPPRQQLASLLSCSREAVSRALKQLEEQGVIAVDGDCVELLREDLAP